MIAEVRASLLGFLIAGVGASSALASGDTLVRQPTFSSIPCRGTVTEFRTEKGNVHNGFSALFLVCRSASDRAQWIIRAAVGCDDGGVDNAPNTCGSPNADPVGKFFVAPEKEPNAHIYNLGRYVFGSDCFAAATTFKRMAAKTNYVRATFNQKGWVCRQANKVEGLIADGDGRVLGPGAFHYVRIVTRGADEKSSAEDQADDTGEDILGVEDRDYHYQVTFAARGVVEK